MGQDTPFLICLWSMLMGGAHMFGDLNYHTETPSPPTVMTMAGPTHVLVHINPDIHKNFAGKIVDYYDKPNLTDFTAFCRCWRSRQFPYCDGFHIKYNQLVDDNVGPIIIRRRNVTMAGTIMRRLRKMSINESEIGTPPLCTRTPKPTFKRKRRPSTEKSVNIDEMIEQYGDILFNYTKNLDDFIHMEQRITSYIPPETVPTTEPEPTLWYPSDHGYRYIKK